MPTIYDVARKAGVSPKTVSRVLNKEPNVRQTTLEAVQRAIEHLDYRPSTAARLMKSQRTRMLLKKVKRVTRKCQMLQNKNQRKKRNNQSKNTKSKYATEKVTRTSNIQLVHLH